ncbi:MAG: efflux RND transporter permease subunit [Bacillota bacterium]
MDVLAHVVVRFRRGILLSLLPLLALFLYGLRHGQIEYDLSTYLPAESPSAVGQRILDREFGYGSTAFLLVKDRPDWEVERLKQQIMRVPGVRSVSWVDDLADIAVPRFYLDAAIRDQFFRDGATMLQIVFVHPGPSQATRTAIREIEKLLRPGMCLSGQAVALAEMRDLADREKPKILAISVGLVLIVLLLALPSPLVPFLFLLTLGFAVVANLGIDYFLGRRISYLTNSVATALQLGVSLDFCIFLWERYREERAAHAREEAMAIAIRQTATAILASAITTVFGFLALAAMRNGLGADLGFTLARGVVFSLFSCLVILPALLLISDRYLFARQHASLIPDLGFLARLVPKTRLPMLLFFCLAFIPAYYSYRHVRVSYDLEKTFPVRLPALQAAEEMRRSFGSVDSVNLVTEGIPPYELEKILAKLERLPGVKGVTTYHRVVDPAIPSFFLPEKLRGFFQAGEYTNTVIFLEERATSKKTTAIIARARAILRPYGQQALLTGSPAVSADLTNLSRTDLPRVNLLSWLLIFLTLAFSFLSFSLPVLLMLVVQLAIWFNQGIAYYLGQEIFYFGTVAIGAIQLGATVDYAVLLTSRFREELAKADPATAMVKAWRESARAAITSAGSLFVATMGIYLGTSLDLVKSLVALIARGAVITLGLVLLVLPALLLSFNRIIAFTTFRWPGARRGAVATEEALPCPDGE